MVNRQLVLVAIDHATDGERTMAFALRTAKARGADVHAIRVVPHRARYVEARSDRGRSNLAMTRAVAIGAARIDAAIGEP